MNITPQVISDLWPLYTSGEASADTRQLVESYLAEHPDLAKSLQDSLGLSLNNASTPSVPPDVELRALTKAKRRLWGHLRLLQLALIFSGLAFGRIVSDTSWDVSPRNFIIVATIAGVFWIAFFVSLYRIRARILVVSPDRGK
jgi:anti-sigma factor RsiW